MARGTQPINDGRINVSVGMRVYPEVYQKLRQRARDENRSIASLIGSVIERGMSEETRA